MQVAWCTTGASNVPFSQVLMSAVGGWPLGLNEVNKKPFSKGPGTAGEGVSGNIPVYASLKGVWGCLGNVILLQGPSRVVLVPDVLRMAVGQGTGRFW